MFAKVAVVFLLLFNVNAAFGYQYNCAKYFPNSYARAEQKIRKFWEPRMDTHSLIRIYVEDMLQNRFSIEKSVFLAEKILSRKLSPEQIATLKEIHTSDFFLQRNLDVPENIGDYKLSHLVEIIYRLNDAGFSIHESRFLVRAGIAGII